MSSSSTPSSRAASRSRVRARNNVVTSDNDNLSAAMGSIVPKQFKGTDRYLDVIQWNLSWFGASKSKAKDDTRRPLVRDILRALNGDLFIFQEVAGPSKDGRYPGALDQLAQELTDLGDGDYVVYYTDAGGQQRVAMMWDQEWLRAKSDVKDLFPLHHHKPADGKDPFAERTPLWGYFTARIPVAEGTRGRRYGGGAHKFDFQALGVHLKAMEEGYAQRLASAQVLARWMTTDAPQTDSDVMIMGDWNAPPDDPCWAPFHALEGPPNDPDKRVVFRAINDPSDYSYLWLRNRSDKYVSRIDLAAMSLSSMQEVKGQAAQVVRWKPIQEVLAQAGSLTDRKVREVMKRIKDTISDHMPVVTRFYFSK